MEQRGFTAEKTKFSSPEEELSFLREEVVRKEKALAEKGVSPERGEVIKETVNAYTQAPASEVLGPGMTMPTKEQEMFALYLSPEAHDKQMESLGAVMQRKGIRNTFKVVEKMNNPHLYDDFHRFLVQYIDSGLPIKDLPERSPLWRPLHMALFEISLPETTKE